MDVKHQLTNQLIEQNNKLSFSVISHEALQNAILCNSALSRVLSFTQVLPNYPGKTE